MRKILAVLLVAPAIGLGGCGIFGGGGSRGPDEFAVARNAPLVIPPDYSLTPPAAGASILTPQDAQSQAIEALFGGPAPRSGVETSLLERAGRDSAPIGVRSMVGDPDTRVIDKGAVTTAILNAPQGDGQIASVQVPQ